LNYWHQITEEIFGPVSVGVIVQSKAQFLEVAHRLQGQLTATIQATEKECVDYKQLLLLLQQKAGRLIFNDFPTGVEVSNAMVHGGPYPATTDSRTTSVGSQAIYRFTRPICLQNFPEMLL
jgi:NADP-dependent aldehyde dehydrogenase